MPYTTEEMLDDFRKDVAARDATIAAQAEAIRLLRAAAEALLAAPIWGHNHWDHTMRHGAGCEICIDQRKAKEAFSAALAATDQHKEPTT